MVIAAAVAVVLALPAPVAGAAGRGDARTAAGQETLPTTLPPAPLRSTLDESGLGGLVISPHIVNIGQVVSMTIAGPVKSTGTCIGSMGKPCVTGFSWEFEGDRVAGCHPQDTFCDWKATDGDSVPPQWQLMTIGIGNYIGPADSEDYYYVLPEGRALSGYVVNAFDKGAAHVPVQVDGPESTKVFTNADGFYDVILEPGTYHVSLAIGAASFFEASECSQGTKEGSSCEVDLEDQSGVASFAVKDQVVHGTIVGSDGKPQDVVPVKLTGTGSVGGSVSLTTLTGSDGRYGFDVAPGTYTLTPEVPGPDQSFAFGYRATSCPTGRSEDGACQDLRVASRPTPAVVNFVYGCPVGDVALDDVAPPVPSQFGIVPTSTVKLTGKGFCPGMTVDFGNNLAEATSVGTKSTIAVSDAGTHADVTVPRLATSGTVTVTSASKTATLDDVAVDSFRNVYGFSFPNLAPPLTLQEFEHVFTNATVVVPFNACPPGNCPDHKTVLVPGAVDVFNAIKAEANGDCFGFSLGAARLGPGGDLGPGDVQAGAADTWDIFRGYTGNPNAPGATLDFINQLQLTQWSFALQSAEYQALSSGAGAASQIDALLGSPPSESGEYQGDAIVIIFQGRSGHAILVYAKDDDDSDPDRSVYDVYDPNQPFAATEDHNAEQHRDALARSQLTIAADGSWSFAGLDWSGTASTIGVLSPSQVEGLLEQGLDYVPVAGQVNAIPGQGTVISSLIAPDGQAVDLSAGASQGVSVLPVISAGRATATLLFNGPAGTYTERLTSKGQINETLELDGSQFTFNASAGTDSVTFDTANGTISVGAVPGAKPSATADIAVDQGLPGGALQEASLGTAPGTGPASLQFTGSGQAIVTASPHRARSIQLTLSDQAAGRPPKTFSATVPVPPGATATVNAPAWSGFNGGNLAATIATGGAPAKTVTLRDRASAPAQPRLGQLQVSGSALLVPAVLPALPSGSTASVTTTFLTAKKVQHQVVTKLSALGRASARTLRVRVPRRSWGQTATATLIVTIAVSGEVVTSTRTLTLRRHR